MARTIRLGRLYVAVAAVVGAPGFGARQAWAGAQASQLTCPGSSVGTCTSQQDCQMTCDALFPTQHHDGDCNTSGCCFGLLP